MIGDVFPDIAHRPVRSHDYFLIFFRNLSAGPSLCTSPIHHPAAIIETQLKISNQRLNLGFSLFLQANEADNYVSYLLASVIYVVVRIHLAARVAQQTDKRVSQNGVAKMAYVGRFIGINTGVF